MPKIVVSRLFPQAQATLDRLSYSVEGYSQYIYRGISREKGATVQAMLPCLECTNYVCMFKEIRGFKNNSLRWRGRYEETTYRVSQNRSASTSEG